MDKVKLVLKFLKKQHFWFLLVLVVLVSSYSWYSARGALFASFSKDKGEIETRKSTATKVAGITLHPNTEQHTHEDELIVQRTKAAVDAWRINYQKQGTDILTWPKELQDDFIDQVKDMRPIESKAKDIGFEFLERYRNYIQEELPKLADMIGAPWLPKDSGGPGGAGGEGRFAAPPAESDDGAPKSNKPVLVQWSDADQSQWKQQFDWSKKPNQIPNTKEVLYAQEDLWVLKALLTIVKKVNGNIDQPHLAGIKAIEFIHIGRDAANTEGSVVLLNPAAGNAAGPGGEGAVPAANAAAPVMAQPGGPPAAVPPAAGAGPGGAGMREGMGPGMGVAGAAGEKLADYRYVDDKYKPLTEERLKAIGQAKDEADAHLAVAKRMPVRLRLRMDMLRVHDLLGECANSPLTVEVRQLRVNPEKVSKGGAGGAGNAGGAGRFGGEGGPMAAGGERGAAGGTAPVSPHDGLVEVYGIIYIYNPVPSTLEESLAALEGTVTGDTAAKPGEAAAPKPATPGAEAGKAAAPATGAAAAPVDGKTAPPAAEVKPAAAAPPAANGATPPAAAPTADDLKAPAAGEKPAVPAEAPGAAAPPAAAEKAPAAATK